MKPAIFSIGQKVKYIGSRIVNKIEGSNEIPQMFPGMIATITKVYPPEKGIGKFFDEDGEESFDYDKDGCNLYQNEHGIGQLIWPKDRNNWQLID